MHETKSDSVIGHLDSVDVDNEIVLQGWLISKELDVLTKNLRIIDNTTNKPVKFVLDRIQRPDVAKAYETDSKKYLDSGFKITIPKKVLIGTLIFGKEEVFDFVAGKEVESPTKTFDEIIRKNLSIKPEIIVVENFYDDPDSVRRFALSQTFFEEKEFYKGKRTKESFVPDWLKPEFERLLGRKISEFTGANGIFQYCTAQDALVYHYDVQEYAAIVYLTPDAPHCTGTSTFKSKITGLTAAATPEDEQKHGLSIDELNAKSFNNHNHYDKTNMELIDTIGNVYNRLIIFNARSIHAASQYFGDNKENSRLFHLFFFNTVN